MNNNQLKDKRIILYSRVSSDEQAEKGYSLDAQEEHLRKWSERNQCSILLHYREEGASAKTFERPAFKKFLALVKENRNITDYFLVQRWDRFSRNMEEALTMIKKLQKQGIIVNATDQWIDFEDPNHSLLLAIHLATPQVENDLKSCRTSSGMRRAMKEGRWIAGAPKGYSFMPDGLGKSKLVPNEKAVFIKEAFREISEGNKYLSSVRLNLSRKGFYCSKSHFSRILRNVAYIGKVKVPPFKDEPEMIVDGQHEALVSESVFYAVQDMLDGKRIRKAPRGEEEIFVLRGFVACPICEKFMTSSFSRGKSGQKYPYYHCKTRECQARYPAEKVNQWILKLFASFRLSKNVAELFKAVMVEIFQTRNKESRSTMTLLEKQIAELEAKTLKVELKYANDELPQDSFIRVKSAYQKELIELKSKKSSSQAVEGDYNKYLSFVLGFLEKIDFYYEQATLEVKRKILSSTLGKKIIFEGNSGRTPFCNSVITLSTKFKADFEASEKETDGLKMPSVPFGTPSDPLVEHVNAIFILHQYVRLAG